MKYKKDEEFLVFINPEICHLRPIYVLILNGRQARSSRGSHPPLRTWQQVRILWISLKDRTIGAGGSASFASINITFGLYCLLRAPRDTPEARGDIRSAKHIRKIGHIIGNSEGLLIVVVPGYTSASAHYSVYFLRAPCQPGAACGVSFREESF